MYEDKLIYGKSELSRIVNVEIDNDIAIILRQMEDGSLSVENVPNRFWILSPRRIDPTWIRLDGDLYYKYGKQYTDRETYLKARNEYRKYDIYSIYDQKEAFLVKDGYTYFKDLNPKEIVILSFDIETTGVNHDSESMVILISNTFRNHRGEVTRKLFSYDEYPSQGEMLKAWASWVRDVDPSIVCGHNVMSFDFPYLQYIADTEGVSIELGRDGSPLRFNEYESSFRIDGSRSQDYKKVFIWGREIVDTMFLSIKYDTASKKYESYGLKNIIRQEGLEVKDREFYDASTIKDNYKKPEEMVKIKRYAEHDADDALALYDLMIAPQFYWAQMIPKSFQSILESATGSQLNAMMVRGYLQDAHSIPKATEIRPYEGAISHGVPGAYKNVLSFDVASLYPSIIIAYKVHCKEKDPRGNFLKISKTLRNLRLEHKKLAQETGLRYYKDRESAEKIGINSLYGSLGASGLNFNYLEGADFITRKGREVLTGGIKWATGEDYETWKKNNNLS